ncbi:MAG: hypothetical protein AAFY20_07970 [Cyanobacteria bacterium J06639_14]
MGKPPSRSRHRIQSKATKLCLKIASALGQYGKTHHKDVCGDRYLLAKPLHVNFESCGKINGLNRHWQSRIPSKVPLPNICDRCWALEYQAYD